MGIKEVTEPAFVSCGAINDGWDREDPDKPDYEGWCRDQVVRFKEVRLFHLELELVNQREDYPVQFEEWATSRLAHEHINMETLQ